MAAPPVARRASRRTGLIIPTLACCGIVVALQQTLVLPLLPQLPRLLSTTRDNASWLVTATLLSGAVATPIVGRVADMFGKRLLMTVCLGVMVLGSTLGALSLSLPLLIAARALQGVGTALIPVGIAAMRDELPPSRVPLGVALMSATLAIGAGAGLPLSGLIAEYLDWHAVFWVSGGAGLVMLVAVPLVLNPSRIRTGGRFDVLGALLLSAVLTAVLLALSKGGHWGWASARTLGLFGTGAALFLVWVPVELRRREPLVDVRTSATPVVLLVNGAAVLIGFGTYANLLVTTQLLQLPRRSGVGLGLDLLHTGLWMAPSAVAFGVMAPLSASIIGRVGARAALLAGAAAMAGAYLARAFLVHGLGQIVGGAVAVSLGTSLAYAAMPILIMRSVPLTETASANGVNTLLRSVGMSMSSAATAAITTQAVAAVFPSVAELTSIFWIAAAACGVGTVLAMSLLRIPQSGSPVPTTVTQPAGM